jgi:hypothetical protein
MLVGLETFLIRMRRWAIPAEVMKEVAQEFRVESKEIVNMVKLQLARGVDGNGQPVYLTRYGMRVTDYAPSTKKKKKSYGSGLGSVTSVITNYMSGRFYQSIRVEVRNDASFEVYSVSPLYDIIKYRSGEDIINLSRESARYLFINEVAPDLQAEINRIYFA